MHLSIMKCILVLYVSLVVTSLVGGEDYWMRANTSATCPQGEENCITLSDMIADSSRFKYNNNNVTIHVLPGVHKPNQSGWIVVRPSTHFGFPIRDPKSIRKYLHNLSFVGHPNHCDKHDCDVTILCESFNIGIVIIRFIGIRFSNFLMKQCGLHVAYNSNMKSIWRLYRNVYVQYRIPNASATILTVDVKSLSMENVHVVESTGYGLAIIEPSNNVSIYMCSFMFNNWKANESQGGNIFILMMENNYNILTVNHTTVSYGKAQSIRLSTLENCSEISANSGGLTIKFVSSPLNTKVLIHNSNFSNNHGNKGANMYITYTESNILDIKNCTFINGFVHNTGGGLYIEIKLFPIITTLLTDRGHTYQNFKLDIGVRYSKFITSHAIAGGGIAITYESEEFGSVCHNTDISCIDSPVAIEVMHCTFDRNTAVLGAGIYHHSIRKGKSNINIIFFTVDINSSLFTNNQATDGGGAMYIDDKDYTDSGTHPSRLQNVWYRTSVCQFLGNTAKLGSAVSVISQPTSVKRHFEISKTTIKYNMGTDTLTTRGAVYIQSVKSIVLQDIKFTKNKINALHINESQVQLNGFVHIVENTAHHGAAIFLDCTPSQFILTRTTSVYITNNTATTYGGGIAVKDGCGNDSFNYTNALLCFFQTKDDSPIISPLVIMENNKAGVAGDDIYGGDLEYCHLNDGRKLSKRHLLKIFKIAKIKSSITSSPYRVCMCSENTKLCTQNSSASIFPGQEFTVPVVGAGQFHNPSPAVIRAEAHTLDGSPVQLGQRQTTQDTRKQCKNLTYSLHTRANSAILKLSVELPFVNLRFPPPETTVVIITVLDCPFGFELKENSSTQAAVCDCAVNLKKQGLRCNINSQTIYREPSVWIGNFSDEIILHHNCPFDYCTQQPQELNPYNQSSQCNFNRTAVLCGACPQGLSLALGTSQCLECTNTFLLLLLPLTLAGILLVLLLLKCDLTVSTGTVNGLIFYANIVQANRAIFFPVWGTKFLSYSLSIFIAWLNLDLGFEVCFTDGLDAYTRTWLQFLFPLYIWILVGLLILVSRYSVTVSRMTGSNTVSVLATLFLLSYAKLLQTTLNIFSFTALTDRNATVTHVWLIDGNYLYLHWPHSALFIAAILTLVAHILPFTFLLLLAPFLQRYTHFAILRWIFKFKPLLDAYQGPYKVKFRWWTGLMLIARLFLYLVFAMNVLGDPRVNLLITELAVLVILILMLWIKVYRKAPLNILETFFMLNLGAYVAAILYTRETKSETLRNIISCCMVGSTFIVFLLILGYHCYVAFSKTQVGKMMINKLKLMTGSAKNNDNDGGDNNVIPPRVQQPTVSYVALKDFREPLLDDS